MENKELIAKFMGLSKPPNPDYDWWKDGAYKTHELKYDSSWDWLMPVTEKIESIYDEHHGYFGVYISSNSCTIQGTYLHKALEDLEGYGYVYMVECVYKTKLEAVYEAVVKFIEWYNKNLKE